MKTFKINVDLNIRKNLLNQFQMNRKHDVILDVN